MYSCGEKKKKISHDNKKDRINFDSYYTQATKFVLKVKSLLRLDWRLEKVQIMG